MNNEMNNLSSLSNDYFLRNNSMIFKINNPSFSSTFINENKISQQKIQLSHPPNFNVDNQQKMIAKSEIERISEFVKLQEETLANINKIQFVTLSTFSQNIPSFQDVPSPQQQQQDQKLNQIKFINFEINKMNEQIEVELKALANIKKTILLSHFHSFILRNLLIRLHSQRVKLELLRKELFLFLNSSSISFQQSQNSLPNSPHSPQNSPHPHNSPLPNSPHPHNSPLPNSPQSNSFSPSHLSVPSLHSNDL